jgi:hypothetical protein
MFVTSVLCDYVKGRAWQVAVNETEVSLTVFWTMYTVAATQRLQLIGLYEVVR